MNILLLRTKKGHVYTQVIADYLISKGVHAYISDIASVDQTFLDNALTPQNTIIHSRTAGLNTNKKIASIEKQGFRVINNSHTLNLTSNKYLAQEHARKNNIPAARTFLIQKSNLARIKEIIDERGVVILKPVYSQGQGIYCQKVDKNLSDDELASIVNSVPGDEIQVQDCVKFKKLIRVVVIGFKALKEACTYDMPTEGWKCSVCMNPNVKHFVPKGDELINLAELTAKVFGAQINFIDFFENMDGDFILNEINTACSLGFHEKATGYNIHAQIGDYLINAFSR